MAGYMRYTYGSSAVDYERFRGSAAPARRPSRERDTSFERRRRLRALEGAGAQHPSISYAQSLLFKVVIAAAAVLLAAGLCSVWMNASTVKTMASTAEISEQVKSAQAQATELELAHADLTNPSHVSQAAEGLGMSVDANADFLTIDRSVAIAVRADGQISIAGTLENVSRAAALG